MQGRQLSPQHQVASKENTCPVLSISAHNNSPNIEGTRCKILLPYNHLPFCSRKATYLNKQHDQKKFATPKLFTTPIPELATPAPAKKTVKPKSTPNATTHKLSMISIPKPAAPAKKTKKPASSASAYKRSM
eukprot:1961955-Ditylum_brightwellii.AAC.2